MRHINALPPAKVPRDSEFSFRERAKSLVDKWHEIISASKADGTVRKPVTNGKHAEDSGAKTEESKKEESPASEDAAAEKSNGDAMEVDKKSTADGEAEVEAEADAPAEEDAPADAAAEEPADVAMSEAAASATA